SGSAPPAVVPSLDGFRGGAALIVLVFHCWHGTGSPALDGGPLRALIAAGHLGVDFFFVLSGFVLFLPTARRGGVFGAWRPYALRRVGRIVPAYYASLLALVVFHRWFIGAIDPLATPSGIAALIAHLLFLQHELAVYAWHALGISAGQTGFEINGAWWTLSI